MSSNSPSWYIPGEGRQPVGPFTAEQLVQFWRTGKLSDKAMCWQEGMTKWLPLAQVEPFASAIRSAAISSRATANVAQSGASPIGKPALPAPAEPLPKRFTAPVVIVACVCGAVALLTIVVAILTTRPIGNDGGGAGASGVRGAKSPTTGAETTTTVSGVPLPSPSGEQADSHLPPADAKDALQGIWVAESLRTSRNELPADAFKHVQFTFQGDRLVLWLGFLVDDDSGPEMICTYSIDPEQSPKHLDFTRAGEKEPSLGIYDLRGDRLTVCFREPELTLGNNAKKRPNQPERSFPPDQSGTG